VPATCPAASDGARNRSRYDRQTPAEPGSRTLRNTPRLPSGARGRRFNILPGAGCLMQGMRPSAAGGLRCLPG
jgi:hypothetical protein